MSEILVLVDNFDKRIPATKRFLFVYDGVAYTLDLCDANIVKFRKDFGRYVDVADKVGPATVTVNGETLGKPKVRAKPYGHPAPSQKITTAEDTSGALAEAPPAIPKTEPAEASKPQGKPTKPTKPTKPAESPELPFTEADPYPPTKDWLTLSADERTGVGSNAKRITGRRYRKDMREWVRGQGVQLGDKGRVPNEWIDKYWDMIQTKRRNAKPGHHD